MRHFTVLLFDTINKAALVTLHTDFCVVMLTHEEHYCVVPEGGWLWVFFNTSMQSQKWAHEKVNRVSISIIFGLMSH